MTSSMMALVALGLLAGAGTARAACLGATPVAAAGTFYRHHYTFWNDPLPTLEQIATARLLRLLKRDRTCADVGEVCAINADPWLDAQDGEARDPRFVAESKNVVQVRYRFVLGDEQLSQPQVARLRLAREGGCWRVDDLVGPNGGSLRAALARFHDAPGGRSSTAPATSPTSHVRELRAAYPRSVNPAKSELVAAGLHR